MPRDETKWLDEIIDALKELGGEATPMQIESVISGRKSLPNTVKGPTIRGIIYKHPGIFYQIRRGLWGFQSDPKNSPAASEGPKPQHIETGTQAIGRDSKSTGTTRIVPRRQRNLLRRLEVERIAIETTDNHFRRHFYKVRSVEKDNIGWDLEATGDRETLLLEVRDFLRIRFAPS